MNEILSTIQWGPCVLGVIGSLVAFVEMIFAFRMGLSEWRARNLQLSLLAFGASISGVVYAVTLWWMIATNM